MFPAPSISNDRRSVKGLNVGKTIIAATYQGMRDTLEVTVKELTVLPYSKQNAINKGNGWPYIEWEINGQCIEFTFVNPTAKMLFAFDYRVDGEEGTIGEWSSTVIDGGELDGEEIGPSYNIVNVPAGETKTVTVCVEEEVWVGLRLGAENDYYLDWIKFEHLYSNY
ncbi:hypothetical protein ES708_33506 [subsurface metagenome]